MKVYIVGASGSGKSTLAARLARILGVTHLELDDFWHELTKGKMHLGKDSQKKKQLQEILRKKVDRQVQAGSWVIDGNYSSVRKSLLKQADMIVFLDYSLPRRLSRNLKRRFTQPERESKYSWRNWVLHMFLVTKQGNKHRKNYSIILPKYGQKVWTVKNKDDLDSLIKEVDKKFHGKKY